MLMLLLLIGFANGLPLMSGLICPTVLGKAGGVGVVISGQLLHLGKQLVLVHAKVKVDVPRT